MKASFLTATALILGILGPALAMAPAKAAELKVLAGGSIAGPLNELKSQFEQATGHKLIIHFDSTPNLIKLITSKTLIEQLSGHPPFDLGVVPVDVFKDADAKARFVPGPTIDIARVGYGVAVRAGAAKPDISTPDALKQTLVKAQSIATLPASAAGAYVLSVFARLGIGEEIKAKIKAQASPADIPQAVAKGEAELGVFLTNVLIAPGVELLGSFPAELQQELLFTAAVAQASKEADAAKALIAFLRSPAATAVIKARGMNPG
jgi:molybdate transport system substrate-binding protein